MPFKKISLLVSVAVFGISALLSPERLLSSEKTESLKPAPETLWDVEALFGKPSKFEWGRKVRPFVQEVYYDGADFLGKPTRAFAYYGKPEGEGPFPGVLLIHGGGGKAFDNWAEHWANRGYAALAMDLAGNGPDGRLPDGGPNQGDHEKFRDFSIEDGDYQNMWTWQSIATILRGHAFLASRPEVDGERIAATGISWGGYLSCILAGVDDRLKAVVPVYGCGFLDESSAWAGRFQKMPPERRDRWISLFDPSKHVGRAKCPMLFVNGTNDNFYYPDSFQKMTELPRGKVWTAMNVRRPHGHIFTFKEVDVFIDGILRPDAKKPLRVSGIHYHEPTKKLSAFIEFANSFEMTGAELAYTTDDGSWPKREWKTIPATIENSQNVWATVPTGPFPTAYFLKITDDRGLSVSSPITIRDPSIPPVTDRNIEHPAGAAFKSFREKAHVAFLGGSITEMAGYRSIVCDWLREQFPKTEFQLTAAGLSSTCSTSGAFRLERDVLSKGPVDLLIVEFAVNDDQDARHMEAEAIRGMEGIVRHLWKHSPNADIVMVFFANEHLIDQYRQGRMATSIAAHRKVAEKYFIPTVDVAREVQQQIDEKELTWEKYGGVHPAPFGNRLAARMIMLQLSKAWMSSPMRPQNERTIDPLNYENGRFVSPDKAVFGGAWTWGVPDWKTIPGRFRPTFAGQKLLCADKPGQELTFDFEGTAVGLFVLAGPDAGTVEYRIDDGETKRAVLFHAFSEGLHYPRTVMLDDQLRPGKHRLKLKLSEETPEKSKGTAVRILQFAVN